MQQGQKRLARSLARGLRVIARELARELAHLGKAAEEEEEGALASLDWGPIAKATSTELVSVARDGAARTLAVLGIDDDESITEQTFTSAVEWARARAAEMVGKSWDDDGELVDNADAEMAISETLREELRDAVAEAIENGDSAAELSDRIEELAMFSEERADMISRTEIIRAHAQGQMSAMRSSGVVERKAWSTSEDGDTCDDCTENEDEGDIDLEDDFPSGDEAPPAHPNCLPGDSLVFSGSKISAASERWYDGDLIFIRTASGKELSCTPNHPILTRRGFVAARHLNEGNYVISAREWMSRCNDDGQNVPSRIQDVAKTLGGSRHVSTAEVPLSTEDFHGDGIGSKVAVIRADRLLWRRFDSSTEKIGGDDLFDSAHVKTPSLDGRGPLNLLLDWMFATANSLVSRLHLKLSLWLAHSRPLEAFGFTSATALDALFHKDPGHDISRDTELPGEFELAGTGQVFADQIVRIDVIPASCHVFNLQTDLGYFLAEGIVTHNCRCVVIAVIDDSSEDEEDEEDDDNEEEDEE